MMIESRTFIVRHFAAILLAVVVGASMLASPIAFRIWMGEGYRGIGMILSPHSQDGAWYHAVIQEAMEGGKPWNAILGDKKDAAYPVPDLAERVMASPGRLFGFGSMTTLLIWRFLLPFILTLTIYAIGVVLVRSRLFGLLSAGAVLFFSPLAHDPLQSLLLAGGGNTLPYTIVSRPVHPQFEAPFVWAFLLMAVLAIQRPSVSRYWIIAGSILGLLTHSYFWAWTWGYALLFLLLLLTSLSERRDLWGVVLKIWGLGIVLGLPALFPLVSAFVSPSDVGYAERLAVIRGHMPAAWMLILPATLSLIFFALRYRRANSETAIFLILGAAATLIALNQQIATGVSLQPDHYMSLISSGFFIWTLAWFGWTWIGRWRPRARIAATAVVLLSGFAFTVHLEERSFQETREYAAAMQPFADVASWLSRHGDPDTVVFANQEIGLLVPVYTRANLWWHSYALAVPRDEQRITHAAFTTFAVNGMSPDDVRAFAAAYPLRFTQLFTLTTIWEERQSFMRDHLEDTLAAYENFRRETSPSSALRAARVDYILFDKRLDRWDPKTLDVGSPVVDNERFILYGAARIR